MPLICRLFGCKRRCRDGDAALLGKRCDRALAPYTLGF
tara:strand:- start:832 stop:945 length:114 start_codon:yes stop_codon:yes gene_type:complete